MSNFNASSFKITDNGIVPSVLNVNTNKNPKPVKAARCNKIKISNTTNILLPNYNNKIVHDDEYENSKSDTVKKPFKHIKSDIYDVENLTPKKHSFTQLYLDNDYVGSIEKKTYDTIDGKKKIVVFHEPGNDEKCICVLNISRMKNAFGYFSRNKNFFDTGYYNYN